MRNIQSVNSSRFSIVELWMTFIFYFLLFSEFPHFSENVSFYSQKNSYLKRNWQIVTLFLDFFDQDIGTLGVTCQLVVILTARVGKWVVTLPSPEATKSQPMCLFWAHTLQVANFSSGTRSSFLPTETSHPLGLQLCLQPQPFASRTSKGPQIGGSHFKDWYLAPGSHLTGRLPPSNPQCLSPNFKATI